MELNVAERNQRFLTAATNNDIETVRRLLPIVNINMIDESSKNMTPLMLAAYRGNRQIVSILISGGANINLQDIEGNTALKLAASKGHKNTVKKLVDAGADINIKNNVDNTALTSAVSNNYIEIVKYLIDKGAEINNKHKIGNTPLIIASINGHTEMVKILIEAGADVNSKNNFDSTALAKAAKKGFTNIVKLLLTREPILTDKIKDYIKQNNFNPEIQGLLRAHYMPWKGKSRGNIEIFDTVFTSEESMRNWSFCPICLGWTPRVDGCMYMKHKCTVMPYYHDKLYKKYKNRAGEISWCTICGRICAGHYHYPLVDTKAARPEPLILIGARPFDNDCRLTNGGGGLPEKIARIRQLRETALELQTEVGKVGHEDAMNRIVEDTWNAAKVTTTLKLQRIMATKIWNISAANFPANVTTSAAANVNANANDPSKYSAPTVLSPGVGAAAEGRNAGYEFNSVSFADDIPLIVFKHKDKDGNERVHPQIGKDSLLADLMTSEKRGKCFDADCGGLLYPREIELAFADPKLAPTITEEDRKTLAKYKEWFNKWRAEDAKTGGRRHRRTRRGKAPKRIRNTRRR